ncbi:hypothetical protein OH492_14490 [Vibrio chagasii]|nr:hypothetical protein [Vibrio chagasii]
MDNTRNLARRYSTTTLKADEFIEANNGYDFFKQTGVLLTTGPTLTNVNDFRAILIL